MDANSRQQPVANERANNPYYEIADKSEACASHDLAGQPACDKANHQNDQETLIWNMHDVSSAASAVPCALIFKWLLLAGR